MKTVKIVGVTNVSKLDDYFSSSMVDIAYIDNIDEGVVTLILEEGIDLDKSEDRDWVMELINKALIQCHESSAKIEIN